MQRNAFIALYSNGNCGAGTAANANDDDEAAAEWKKM